MAKETFERTKPHLRPGGRPWDIWNLLLFLFFGL